MTEQRPNSISLIHIHKNRKINVENVGISQKHRFHLKNL